MNSSYDRVTELVGTAVNADVYKALYTTVADLYTPIRVWDGMQTRWVIHRDVGSDRIEASVSIRPAVIEMLGKERRATEFKLTIGCRAWKGEETLSFWTYDGPSKIVKGDSPEKAIKGWVASELTRILRRADREVKRARKAQTRAPRKRITTVRAVE
ncbi:hypothetical protein ABZW18_20975 [Streptomyces sp. NPDC004647]|uniref:hypothetical protein n=1 Tax=Streptomyces sp. NPDC004647 TaxID=3154671 RepID=UPI0033B9876D